MVFQTTMSVLESAILSTVASASCSGTHYDKLYRAMKVKVVLDRPGFFFLIVISYIFFVLVSTQTREHAMFHLTPLTPELL